jgi:hypothetical protein
VICILQNEIFLLLCPNHQHHVWIGNSVNFQEFGIEVDDNGSPIMSRFIKWISRVSSGEVTNKNLVGAYLLTSDLSIHL